MGLLDGVKAFGALHDRWRCGELPPAELERYQQEREALADALLAAQRITLEPGQKARRTLRVARALRVEVQLHDGGSSAQTLNVSAGGFAALVQAHPEIGDEARVVLHLPDGAVRVGARVVDVRPARDGSTRVGFQFQDLEDEDADRLEGFVFDAVLGQLRGG